MKTKDYRRKFKTLDRVERRNNGIHFRTTKEIVEILDSDWKNRYYPDPNDRTKFCNFESRQQYIEFLIRSIHLAGPTIWSMIAYMLDPDFDKFKVSNSK